MTDDRARLLADLAAKRAETERTILSPNLGALFDRAVERHGHKPLWVSLPDGRAMSYREIGQDVRRCVGALQALGVTSGTHVGVMLPSVPAVVIAWMALARLGAVMIPINTRYTARELDHVLVAGRVELLIVDQAFRGLVERAARGGPGRAGAASAGEDRRGQEVGRARQPAARQQGPPASSHRRPVQSGDLRSDRRPVA